MSDMWGDKPIPPPRPPAPLPLSTRIVDSAFVWILNAVGFAAAVAGAWIVLHWLTGWPPLPW